MGLIRDKKTGSNVSVAKVNGYTVDNVIKAKKYLKEIGGDRRNFPIERLVEMYNDIKGTKEKAIGCKPCQASKYYMGLQNYVTYGELTLINNGVATEDDFDIDKVKEEPVIEEVKEEEAKPKLTPAERMAKAREARKLKKNEENKD